MANTALAARIEAATPAGRDRAMDALRATAIGGVVVGHWLVTALVAHDDGLAVASPLTHLDAFTPASWLFQTLAVFFLVGGAVAGTGYARARQRGTSYGTWLTDRLRRLTRPALALLSVWAVVTPVLLLTGTGTRTVHTILTLVLSPLWFLLVFAALTALTPLARHLHPGWPLLIVIVVDIARFGFDAPPALGWINLAAGWLVPYTLGMRFDRRLGWPLLITGTLATIALVRWAGYPASMVGVPGQLSNLNPPTLAAVTFGLAQSGAAMLLHAPLNNALLRHPRAWTAVALTNLSAMTIFLWHQTSMITITTLPLLLTTPLPGLHTTPTTPTWLITRLFWLPLFAIPLAIAHPFLHRFETPHRSPHRSAPSHVIRPRT